MQASNYKKVAAEEFDGRKITAVEQSINNHVTSDIIWQFEIQACVRSNDAKSCYDRILHVIASSALQCLELPIQLIRSILNYFNNCSIIFDQIL